LKTEIQVRFCTTCTSVQGAWTEATARWGDAIPHGEGGVLFQDAQDDDHEHQQQRDRQVEEHHAQDSRGRVGQRGRDRCVRPARARLGLLDLTGAERARRETRPIRPAARKTATVDDRALTRAARPTSSAGCRARGGQKTNQVAGVDPTGCRRPARCRKAGSPRGTDRRRRDRARPRR
jgi:hypothetical protein